MKVILLQDVAGDPAYTAGQQADVADALARQWIEQGLARPLDVAGVKAISDAAIARINGAENADDLEKVRIQYLGRNGEITLLAKGLGTIPAELRRDYGQAVNAAKQGTQEAFDARKASLATTPRRSKDTIDVTLPGIRRGTARRHPLMQTMEEVKTVLQGLGFRYDDYPELETEFYNFDGLNTPEWHPSRDMHDSFYTASGNVVRTHTSAFQVRAMRSMKTPPIRAMTAGRCYRNDEIDATHFPIFNQLDVIAIDRQISMADLKWTLDRLLRVVLGADIELRFRPSYFPFTTPSAEVDVLYRGRWMELLGSGMMRPEVLRHGGIDTDKYQGFAFGMGIDRLTMARFNIDDIRLLYTNEEAFLAQF
jgi:phenylalanyl-tRNA synthetase alpha chain